MCGISGLVALGSDRPFLRGTIKAMNEAMLHRGPDAEGIYQATGMAFGHRRLSILDHEGGTQPMATAGGCSVLTFNGEIYNAGELRAELEALDHEFKTSHSDTEVVLYAWQQWGEACVERFRGMFAFAIWDAPKKRLFLARDRLGIKPLYYTIMQDKTFAFASELKGLLVLEGLNRELNSKAVENYLSLGYIPDPETIYKGVFKLEAGCYLTIGQNDKEPVIVQYWDLDFTPTGQDGYSSPEVLIEALRNSVDIRMMADVPLGAFLSGGVDSSAIVALMTSLSNKPVESCAIGFEDSRFDETEYAQKVADMFNTHHRERLITDENSHDMTALAAIFDEPFADSSAISTLRVCSL